jgi:hypothetical protein
MIGKVIIYWEKRNENKSNFSLKLNLDKIVHIKRNVIKFVSFVFHLLSLRYRRNGLADVTGHRQIHPEEAAEVGRFFGETGNGGNKRSEDGTSGNSDSGSEEVEVEKKEIPRACVSVQQK